MAKKIGIIGAGGMLRYHIEGFRKAGATVTALADVNGEAANAAASAYDIEHTYDDVDTMLQHRHDLDAVSIIVPNAYHKALSLMALNAGKHVFCEKPPALNVAEVEEMIAAAETAGRTLMFNFNNRARPAAVAIKAYIDAGEVGRINSAQARWIRRTGIPGFGGWFTQRALSGGGPMIDLLHMLDLALYFMGYPEPSHVLARTYDDFINDPSFKGPWGLPDVAGAVNDVESAIHGIVTFSTGQVLSFQTSWAEMIRREEVSVTFQGQQAGGLVRRLFGIDGIDETANDEAELYVQEHGCSVTRAIVNELDLDMGRVRSACNFVRVLNGEEAPLNTPDEGLKLMRIVDAAYASARTGAPVSLG